MPSHIAAERLAAEVRRVVLGSAGLDQPLLDLDSLLSRGGFGVAIEPLSAVDGRVEAFLVPDRDNRFEIVVDPEPKGGWRVGLGELQEEVSRHRFRFRVCHEIAHSFFYTRACGQAPRRRVPDSREQEQFCDVFAGALLLPPSIVASSQPSPEAIVRVQQEYDVSLQLAVRAFANAHAEHLFALLYSDERAPHVRLQWATPSLGRSPRWWADDTVQALMGDPATTVAVSCHGGERARFDAMWLAARRQGLMVGAAS